MVTITPVSPIATQRATQPAPQPAPFARAAAAPAPPAPASEAAIAFEAVVLRTFVEAMLPEDGFGEGTAGHMWRGQMADALADTLARGGGVGIAAIVERNGQ